MEGSLVEFAALLRQGGLRVSPGELADAARALELVGLGDRSSVRADAGELRSSSASAMRPPSGSSSTSTSAVPAALVADIEKGLLARLEEEGAFDPDTLEMLAWELHPSAALAAGAGGPGGRRRADLALASWRRTASQSLADDEPASAGLLHAPPRRSSRRRRPRPGAGAARGGPAGARPGSRGAGGDRAAARRGAAGHRGLRAPHRRARGGCAAFNPRADGRRGEAVLVPDARGDRADGGGGPEARRAAEGAHDAPAEGAAAGRAQRPADPAEEPGAGGTPFQPVFRGKRAAAAGRGDPLRRLRFGAEREPADAALHLHAADPSTRGCAASPS